jgi:TetR/AcrR family transcriptional repressor of nem operon
MVYTSQGRDHTVSVGIELSGGAAMSKGEETQQRIVTEAATIFNQRGFEGGSLAELMEATGLEKGGIYRHFSSKEELALEAFDYAWRAAFSTRIHGLDAIANSADRLKQFIANFVGRRPPVPGGCPLLNTAIDADDGNLALRERARKALREWRDRLSSIIIGGIEAGEIRRGVEARKLATLIISSLEGALMIGRLERSREALFEVQDYLESYIESEVRLPRTTKSANRK